MCGKPKILKGKIGNLAAGRVDVLYNKDDSCLINCKQVQHHWSSTKYLNKDVQQYFGRSSSFISCTVGDNCEKKMAHSFGKVIGPRGKKPSVLIIVGGDSAETPKGLKGMCKKKGCYVVSSNSMPQKTSANSIVITGHHIEVLMKWRLRSYS